ncbi:MAG: siroheme synthase CysG [Gammaproteobacteria bacterium]|nr:siroheme synthase CysG [Gammaproteobacteria bacterium]
MDVLPLSLKLTGQPVLVVGGGEVARRKIELLVAARADIEVVAPAVSADLRAYCTERNVNLTSRTFQAADVDGRLLVVAATSDEAVNGQVQRACADARVLVNCVDDGARSTALFPAIVDRGTVTVAISTGGASPTLARRMRELIERVLPSNLGALADYLASRRERLRSLLPDIGERRRFWDRAIDSDLADLAAKGDVAAADERLVRAAEAGTHSGLVSLVGAGPGDPDLLTVKALQRLQRADVVYYDNLVGDGVLERCRRDARRVFVGRRAAYGRAPDTDTRQRDINKALLADAKRGLRVVRLKGGDPLVFSRGGEEVAALGRHGVPFEIVPGITAALGCAAIAGIPLTHRDWAQSVRFVTGHRRDGVVSLDWEALAQPDQTVVVYMGLATLPTLCAQLIAHGLAPATPAATVVRGTLPDQEVIAGHLDNLADRVATTGSTGPATTIIGRVAGLAQDSASKRAG